jgi:hypothetical protein
MKKLTSENTEENITIVFATLRREMPLVACLYHQLMSFLLCLYPVAGNVSASLSQFSENPRYNPFLAKPWQDSPYPA